MMSAPLTLRIDDVGPTPGDMVRACQLADVAAACDVPVLFAVTPCLNQVSDVLSLAPPEAWEPLRLRLGNNMVALHGTTHCCRVLPLHEHRVERVRDGETIHEYVCRDFGPIPQHIQATWLQEGLHMLDEALGVSTDVMIAPAHYFDDTTLYAAAETGFAHTSTYDRFAQTRWYHRAGVWLYPADVTDYLRVALSTAGVDVALQLWQWALRDAAGLQMFWHANYDGFRDDRPFTPEALDAAYALLHAASHRTFTLPGS